MNFKKLLLIPFLALVAGSCSNKEPEPEPPQPQQIVEPTLTVESSDITIMLDKGPYQIGYTVLKTGFVAVTNSDSSVLTATKNPDNKGITINPLSEGIAYITLKRGEYSLTIKVTVVPYEADDFLFVSLTNDDINLLIGDTFIPSFNLKYGSNNISQEDVTISYLSYDELILSVDGSTITALAAGTSEVLTSITYSSSVNYYCFTINVF